MDQAKKSGCDLLFEAAVAGAIPIIRPLKQCLAGNHLSEIMGIVNGTTNFILTKMAQDGMEFEEALHWRQSLAMQKRIRRQMWKAWTQDVRWQSWLRQHSIHR